MGASWGMATISTDAARSEEARLLLERPAAPRARGRRSRAVIALTLGFWLSNLLLLSLGTLLSGNVHWLGITAMRALAILFGLLLCYGIHVVMTRMAGAPFRRRVIVLACMVPVAAETFAWAHYFGIAAADPVVRAQPFTWSGVVSTISFWSWFFLAWAGLYLALLYSFDVQDERDRANELQSLAHAARLRALHYQVNPHFLFNSLNSIAALILDRQMERAEAMVVKLAHFFRMGLAVDPLDMIVLSREVALQRAYLEIEQLRYPDLAVTIGLPEALDDALVPTLILQPIVENAVKYGVAGSSPPTQIVINAHREGDALVIEVADSGDGAQKAGGGAGIGLANVRQRLALHYGEAQRLETGPLPDRGYRVRLTLPLEVRR